MRLFKQVSAAMVFLGCSAARNGVEEQVLATLRENSRFGGGDVAVDSVRLENTEISSYAGFVYLSADSIREQDSIYVKSTLSGIEIEAPKPGRLLSRVFREH